LAFPPVRFGRYFPGEFRFRKFHLLLHLGHDFPFLRPGGRTRFYGPGNRFRRFLEFRRFFGGRILYLSDRPPRLARHDLIQDFIGGNAG
jgi:hypothetical protein